MVREYAGGAYDLGFGPRAYIVAISTGSECRGSVVDEIKPGESNGQTTTEYCIRVSMMGNRRGDR